MWLRLHVAQTHKIEYAPSEFFNWKIDEIANIIDNFCEDHSSLFDKDGCAKDSFEVSADEFSAMIGKIEKMDANDFFAEYSLIKADVLEGFKYLYFNRDADNYYINLYWF